MLTTFNSSEQYMLGGLLKEFQKNEDKEKSAVAEFVDELAQSAAAVIGAATGLTPNESKSFIQNNEKIAEVAEKVAIANDLEHLSRQQQQDGLTIRKNIQTATSTKQKQELDLKTKTA